jgi:hypothetical protein
MTVLRRALPKHRTNPTFSRLLVARQWASVLTVVRVDAPNGAFCQPPAREELDASK